MLRHPWPSCWHRVMTGGPSIQELLWHGTVDHMLGSSMLRMYLTSLCTHFITICSPTICKITAVDLFTTCMGWFHVLLQYFHTVGWVFWPVKTVANITYTVLVETLNHSQLINPQVEHCTADISDCCTDKWLQFNASKTVWSPLVSAVMSLTALCWWPDR